MEVLGKLVLMKKFNAVTLILLLSFSTLANSAIVDKEWCDENFNHKNNNQCVALIIAYSLLDERKIEASLEITNKQIPDLQRVFLKQKNLLGEPSNGIVNLINEYIIIFNIISESAQAFSIKALELGRNDLVMKYYDLSSLAAQSAKRLE